MGYLGRRIGLSQDKGDSTPGGADGAVGGGILDLFASGYFQRQGNIFNHPGQPKTGHVATGGIINDYSDGASVYRAHVFISSGTFGVTQLGEFGSTVEYLVVAGGGSGGGKNGGAGGGAGGVRTNLTGHPLAGSPFPVSTSPGSYTVTVGAGAAGVAGPTTNGNQGTPSVFGPGPISATGGGYGGNGAGGGTGGNGGSGGGGGENHAGGAGTNYPGPTQQGFPGGANPPPANGPAFGGGGGGGFGGAGGDGTSSVGGAGGIGGQIAIAGPSTASPVGTPGPSGNGYFAGGGGGGTENSNPGGGAGGYGGGGNAPGTGSGVNGTRNTGGGGGGASVYNSPTSTSGAGGSGIVVVRYQIASTGTAKATGGAVSFYSGKTIHAFTSSGTFVNPASIDNVEVVMVAGGGAGGNNIGAGGGAGAVLESPGTGFTFPNNTYTITVGAGAAGKTSLGPATPGTATDTTISYPGPYTWTAQRGGYGAGYPNIAAQPGGSGGGGAPDNPSGGSTTAANSPTPIGTLTAYGNAGAAGPGNYQGAGGGGAGAAGGAPPGAGVGGSGGIGRQLPTTFRDPRQAPSDSSNPQPYQRGGGLGTPGPAGSYYVAGGGGGAAYDGDHPANRGLGGAGGGGDGAWHTNSPPNTDGQSALENTGSGGGGAGYSPGAQSTPGSGGSGLVLIAYPS